MSDFFLNINQEHNVFVNVFALTSSLHHSGDPQ